MSLSASIKSIQDIMRKDVGVDGDAQRLSQLAWMLFLKIFDAQETELEMTRDDYRSPFPQKLRWRNWAADTEGITGDELMNFINDDLFPGLKELKGGSPRHHLIRNVFEDAYNYMKSGTLLRQVINKLNEGIDFNKSQDRHLFGDIYEQLLRDLQNAGNAGEYYTPRAVTQFMVERTNPRLGKLIFDPACGTGGFLTCALEHIRQREVKSPADEQRLQDSIRGVEKKPLPHLLCTTNMLLHGIEVPVNVRHDNTLAKPYASYTSSDRVDVIMTNPPFGGMEEDGTEKNFPAAYRTKETADLFLVLIVHLLRDGGHGAIVLPDGTLFGEGIKTRIKQELLEKCNLHTIVRLPNGVFAPYTGIKTNLLFFTKGEPTKEIWYYEHPYPPGVKNYNKTKPIRIEEFDAEKKWWGKPGQENKRKETEFAWRVSIADIAARGYNLDVKNPHTVDAAHRDPAELLAEYQKAQAAVAEVREKLRKEWRRRSPANTMPDEVKQRFLYIFLDEAGNLEFSRNGTKYFVLGGITKERPFHAYKELTEFKYDQVERGTALEYFHASENAQAVRNGVFDIIEKHLVGVAVDAIIVEKQKVDATLREEEQFFPKVLGTLLREILQHYPLAEFAGVIVFTDSLPVQRKRTAVEKGVKMTLAAMLPASVRYRVLHHASKSNLDLQIADYCTWAIYRKWNGNDDRSFHRVRAAVRSEWDVLQAGTGFPD